MNVLNPFGVLSMMGVSHRPGIAMMGAVDCGRSAVRVLRATADARDAEGDQERLNGQRGQRTGER